MSIVYINTGSGPNAGDGDSIRSAFIKINNNFAEIGPGGNSKVTVSARAPVGIDGEITTFDVFQKHRIRDVVENGAQAVLALAQSIFARFALCDIARNTH